MRAVVVFLGKDLVHGPARYISFLKKGFVHCFLLLETSGGWLKIEGQCGAVKITYLGQITDVADHYRQQGAIAVETTVRGDAIRTPLVARTCVGITKAVLGLRSLAVTPWQLHKHLMRG